jgi:capsular polysaccharide biosynthesis protein
METGGIRAVRGEYGQIMRSRFVPWLALVTCVAAGAAAAAGYALTAPKRYRATAQLLVAPVAPSDSTFAGLQVFRDTGGKRTAAADVAALVRSPQVADAVAAQLALRRSGHSLLGEVTAHVVDASDVVDVNATDASASAAAELANTFGSVLVSQRTALFQSDLARAIHRDEQLVANGASRAVATRLTTLRGFVGQPDPTVRVASDAGTPTSSSWPNVGRIVLEGLAAGAGAGILLAAALLALRRRGRSRREDYDRGVESEAVEQLVERLEARLSAREAALAARERDVQSALAELRTAQERHASADTAAAELADREQQHTERVAAVQQREVALARRAAELGARERELEAEQTRLERRERELAAREEALEARAAELEEQAAAAPPPAAPVVALVGDPGDGRFNLVALERLVEERRGDFPDRAEEWLSYLYFLRDYAAPDGSVPASFDGLIQDTFSELVA